MKKLIIFLQLISACSFGQNDTSFLKRTKPDTSKTKMNLDAVYNRPFLKAGSMVSIGGYLEANSSYFVEDGITEGLSFQVPRLTVFLSSQVKNRIRFLTEIELEEGGKEIGVEFASLDITLHPLLNFRGGIVLNPIGAFNQNHDGPKWEFVARPLSATTIIPSTWSNAGFGLFGKYGRGNLVWAYEAYLTNGFDGKIVANEQERTWLPASKINAERFNESFNGIPLVTAKTAIKYLKAGEIGVSWMGGVYNKFQSDGLVLDKRRRVDLFAIDINSTLKSKTYITGEWVWAMVDVPGTYSQQFGSMQRGGFVDIVQPIIRREVFGWNSVLSLAVRGEYVDYNVGSFDETGGNIFDHVYAITPGISFRPSMQTVIRLNYVRRWETDLLGNPPVNVGGIQFGLSSYF